MDQSSLYDDKKLNSPPIRKSGGDASISIVMTAYNAEDLIDKAIESVLNQSFSDFKFIIVNDGSTDNTRSIICSYKDNRIQLIDNGHDYIQSLNTGLRSANGKYLARMDADDICHIDRLKIQHTIMEKNPEITVCCCLMNIFGEKVSVGLFRQNYSGLIESPLVQLLLNDFVVNPSTMIRNSFLKEHNLLYEEYTFAEDYKFWAEAAMLDAIFYLESQPLVYKRIDKSQVSIKHRDAQIKTSSKIKKEILYFLCEKYKKYPALESLSNTFYELLDEQLISEGDLIKLFYTLLINNKDKLT